MLRPRIPALALALGLSASLAAPALAQDVEWTTATKVDFSGFLGTVARMFGGGDETIEKTYIKGGKMRTDSDKTSSILDLDAGRVISIDHESKTYTMMTFEQMAQQMERAMEQAKQEARQANPQAQESQEQAAQQPEGEVELDYELRVEKPGERQKINGYDAERIHMIMETEATVTPEGEEAQKAGKLVVLMDMWNAENVPVVEATNAFYSRYPQEAARHSQSMQNMAAAFATNPQMQEAMEEAAKESEKVSGFPVREVTYMVLVPPDMELDVAAVLSGGQKSGAGETVKKGLGGLLRGAIGGNREQQQEEPEEMKQATIMTMTTETREIRTTSLSDDLFNPPAGYTERQFNMGGGTGR